MLFKQETEDYQEDLKLEITIGGYMLDIVYGDYVYLQSPQGTIDYYEWGDRKSWETKLKHCGILSRVLNFCEKLSNKTGNSKPYRSSSKWPKLVEMESR